MQFANGHNMRCVMRKPAFCICKNKADHYPFCYIVHSSEISSLSPSFVALQPSLCGTWSETLRTVFQFGDVAHYLQHKD